MPLEIERKYLIQAPHVKELRRTPWTWIQQYYFESADGVAERIRWQADRYYHTIKTFIREGVCEEDEHEIDQDEFNRLLGREGRLPNTIIKRRYAYSYMSLVFEVDQFVEPRLFWMLEVELPSIDHPFTLPPWVRVVEEVTHDRNYSNAQIARWP